MEDGMSYVDLYLRMVDLLRESRRSKSWRPEHDRPLLAHLEDLYEKLDDPEQNRVESEGWRAWPEQYDARMRALADLEEVPLDAADDGRVNALPRRPKAA
jgi:hypothetical protein